MPLGSLDAEAIYEFAVTIDRIGVELDRHRVDKSDAFEIYKLLNRSIDLQLQRFEAGDSGPVTARHLAQAFSDICERIYENAGDTLAPAIIADVTRVMSSQVELQARFDRMLHAKRSAPLYSDPAIELECRALLDSAPIFHLASDVYDQCERSNWDNFRLAWGLLPAPFFRILIDGETWLPLSDDPTQQAQTKWLLIDARARVWRLYEKSKTRGIDRPSKAQVIGVTFDTGDAECQAMESRSIQMPVAGEYQPWTLNPVSASRLIRVLGTFVLLLQNERVAVARSSNGDHRVTLPGNRSVNQLANAVIERAKTNKK